MRRDISSIYIVMIVGGYPGSFVSGRFNAMGKFGRHSKNLTGGDQLYGFEILLVQKEIAC